MAGMHGRRGSEESRAATLAGGFEAAAIQPCRHQVLEEGMQNKEENRDADRHQCRHRQTAHGCGPSAQPASSTECAAARTPPAHRRTAQQLLDLCGEVVQALLVLGQHQRLIHSLEALRVAVDALAQVTQQLVKPLQQLALISAMRCM